MAFKRHELIASITDNLAFSSKSISLQNVLGLFDDNRDAQVFFAGLLQKVCGYSHLKELDKLNDVTNYPAIDLGDTTARVAFQITTETSSTKVKDTISKFNKHKLYERYDRLIIFLIGEKPSYTTDFETDNNFQFDKDKDIWDDKDFAKKIDAITEISELQAIQSYLVENLLEFKFPDRLFEKDIRDCISLLRKDIGKLLGDNPESIQPSIPDRQGDFINAKNKVNNVSWDFFKEKIRGHLQYNQQIDDFLRDPINEASQKEYLEVTSIIQKYYEQNKNKFSSFEDVFRSLFEMLTRAYDSEISDKKIKILLHNMYFNCDIGSNPTYAEAK